jgi:hypothetical protein
MKYLLFLCLPFLAGAQQADALFGQLVQKFKKVHHYEVLAQIKPNIPMIRILPVRANIQFQYPNSYKIQSAGISILPKNGFSELPQLFSKPNQFTVIASGQETLDGVNTSKDLGGCHIAACHEVADYQQNQWQHYEYVSVRGRKILGFTGTDDFFHGCEKIQNSERLGDGY